MCEPVGAQYSTEEASDLGHGTCSAVQTNAPI